MRIPVDPVQRLTIRHISFCTDLRLSPEILGSYWIVSNPFFLPSYLAVVWPQKMQLFLGLYLGVCERRLTEISLDRPWLEAAFV